MRIAVVGATGQLGAAVVRECSSAHDVVALDHARLDVTVDAAVAETMRAVAPDAIINAAAYNLVDAAEDHPIDALDGNAFAVRALARAASDLGAMFVHYSSDFVFDGTASVPYVEEDRSCWGSGSRLRRRTRTCCAWRACSDALQTPGRPRARSRR